MKLPICILIYLKFVIELNIYSDCNIKLCSVARKAAWISTATYNFQLYATLSTATNSSNKSRPTQQVGLGYMHSFVNTNGSDVLHKIVF